MAKKRSLKDLNKELRETEARPEPKTRAGQKKIEANIPRGERSGFLKITITIPPDLYSALKELGLKRKVAGEKDTDVSALLREAATDLLKKSH